MKSQVGAKLYPCSVISIRAIRTIRTQYLYRNISLRIISLRDIDKPGYGAKNITEYYSEHWVEFCATIVVEREADDCDHDEEDAKREESEKPHFDGERSSDC